MLLGFLWADGKRRGNEAFCSLLYGLQMIEMRDETCGRRRRVKTPISPRKILAEGQRIKHTNNNSINNATKIETASRERERRPSN
eukprot:scaffold2258_cov144-Skeletonema_menzelii.AAC.20